MGAEDFIEFPGVKIDDDHVPIPLAFLTPFDGRVAGYGVGALIALVGVFELDRNTGLIFSHDNVGDAAGSSVPNRTEIGVQRPVEANRREIRLRLAVDRQSGNVGVPRIVGGEDGQVAE